MKELEISKFQNPTSAKKASVSDDSPPAPATACGYANTNNSYIEHKKTDAFIEAEVIIFS